jgi:hypothetical protein
MPVISSSLLNPRKLSYTEFEKAVHHMLQENFPDGEYFTVIEERRKYNAQVSEEIWLQHKGRKAHVVEVYWKGEFVCDIRSTMQPREALNKVKEQLIYVKEGLDPVTKRQKIDKEKQELENKLIEDIKKKALEKRKSIKIEKKDEKPRKKNK